MVQTTSLADTESARDSKGNILPDVGLKWGTTPKKNTLSAEEEEQKRQALEDFYTEEEKEKMRAKGINPLLKAEIDMGKKGRGGFWAKVAGTAMGGGVVK